MIPESRTWSDVLSSSCVQLCWFYFPRLQILWFLYPPIPQCTCCEIAFIGAFKLSLEHLTHLPLHICSSWSTCVHGLDMLQMFLTSCCMHFSITPGLFSSVSISRALYLHLQSGYLLCIDVSTPPLTSHHPSLLFCHFSPSLEFPAVIPSGMANPHLHANPKINTI